MAMKRTLGLAAAQPEVAMQTQKMAIRILMAATHHPPTATTPQGKAFHPPRLAKIAKQTSVWWKAALLSGVL
jgi:hypothetical protein